MRISDWSSDVCSSDLPKAPHRRVRPFWTSTSTAGHSPVALQSCKTLATRSRLSSTRIRSPAVSTSDTRWSLTSAGLADPPRLLGGLGVHPGLPVPKREQRKLRPGGLLQLRDGVQSGLRHLEGHLFRFDLPHTSLLHRRGLGD